MELIIPIMISRAAIQDILSRSSSEQFEILEFIRRAYVEKYGDKKHLFKELRIFFNGCQAICIYTEEEEYTINMLELGKILVCARIKDNLNHFIKQLTYAAI